MLVRDSGWRETVGMHSEQWESALVVHGHGQLFYYLENAYISYNSDQSKDIFMISKEK